MFSTCNKSCFYCLKLVLMSKLTMGSFLTLKVYVPRSTPVCSVVRVQCTKPNIPKSVVTVFNECVAEEGCVGQA